MLERAAFPPLHTVVRTTPPPSHILRCNANPDGSGQGVIVLACVDTYTCVRARVPGLRAVLSVRATLYGYA